MSIAAEALSVTGIGLLIVFAGLIILIVFVYLMACFFRRTERAQDAAVKVEPAPAPAPVVAPVAAAEPAQEGIDPQVVAAISAAIAAYDTGAKSLVIRSVRRVSGWKRASRAEQVSRF